MVKNLIFMFYPLEDGMENWTQDKLEEVVKKKHEEAEKKKPKTDIVSRLLCLPCSFAGVVTGEA